MKIILKKIPVFALATVLLAACAPPALQVLSLVADGVSYVATEKTVADHALSAVADKDCKILRGFQDKQICQEDEQNALPDDHIFETSLHP